MLSFWRRLFGATPQIPPLAPPVPRPDPPICVIGDVHGMSALLDILLKRIAAEPQGAVARIVLVGDLIDRGPDSAAVLRRVHALCRANPAQVICLMGNHERMMLDFLARPVTAAPQWLGAGGQETLYSFGIRAGFSGMPPTRRFPAMAEALRAALTPDLLDWISALPLVWQDQGVAVVHASARPTQSLANQSEATLLWGRPLPGLRADGLWLVHGHVIVPQVQILPGRIAVDTGAWRSGRLSAIWIGPNGAHPLTTDLGEAIPDEAISG